MNKVKDGIYGYGPDNLLWVRDNIVVNGSWEVLVINDNEVDCRAYPRGFGYPFVCDAVKGFGNYNEVIYNSWENHKLKLMELNGDNYEI